MSAACELQNSRCSLPGESDWPQDDTTISKSQLRSRFSYCAGSMVRTLTSMPRRSSEGLKNSMTRSNEGSAPSNSMVNGAPVLLSISLRSRTS